MKCIRCGNKVVAATTTSVTDLGDILIIVRNVPCFKCEECDEVHYTADVVSNLESIINTAKLLRQEISVVDYNKNIAA